MRVLHLIDGGFRCGRGGVDCEEAALACRLLVRSAGCVQRVCVLGPRPAVARVERLGLAVDAGIAPSLGLPEAGWRSLRRLLRAWGRPELIQCWGHRAARLALRAMGDSVPRIVVSAEGESAPGDVALTFSEAARVRLLRAGCEARTVAVVPPPAWQPRRSKRDELRRELGVVDGELLVAQLGSPPQADAMRFMFLIGLLGEARLAVRGVARVWAAERARAVAFGRGIGRIRVSMTRRPMVEVLGACDLAVFDGGGPGPTRDWDAAPWAGPPAIAPAYAAGVPVVAPAWSLGERPEFPECAALNSTLPELARRLMQLVDDAALRGRIARDSRQRFGGEECGDAFVRAVAREWDEAGAVSEVVRDA